MLRLHADEQYVMAEDVPYLIRTTARHDTAGTIMVSIQVSSAGWTRTAPIVRTLIVTPVLPG